MYVCFSALRWTDEKCRENGIECTAENCRQMLGPALFQIRFPLFSQKEFSEKIVPSGILTAEEVVCVEHYRTNLNFCGHSGGLLYPLQFPSNWRLWTFGTLLMEIEKASEFAGEMAGSSRYSETLYINGLPWKIWAQIKTKSGSTNNEKCLGIYLLCTALEKDSQWRCCVRSATFRIISQKNGVDNSIGTFCDHVFDNKSNNWGFNNFILFTELMDPSRGLHSGEEDKVTLAIDVTVKNEKMDKFILDQSKSNGTISMDIEKVSEFAREVIWSERKSEIVYIKGFLWKIMAEMRMKMGSNDNEKWLGIYLWCDTPKEEEKNWSCKCSATIRIMSQKCGVSDFRRKFDDHVFDSEENSWGYGNTISFIELMNPRKGFYNKSEDKVTLAIDVTVENEKTEDNS
ncbi:hypothetical protein niasHT_010240 [Heterodera trifolii]|uniref:MATH domain-containing protein n=1 Tax=Heterodera trifolii TaxID=157864 RepID=A0ABD2LR08_9BILA